jgi:hypothetical protein
MFKCCLSGASGIIKQICLDLLPDIFLEKLINMTYFVFLVIVRIILIVQKEYLLVKPARDAAIIAKLEAEALSVPEGPLHTDNEWNIRWVLG